MKKFLIILSICIITATTVLFFSSYESRMNQKQMDAEVQELMKYFEEILLLNVSYEETANTPLVVYNRSERYPNAQASVKVKYKATLNSNSGIIRIKYTQKLYSNEAGKKVMLCAVEDSPAEWTIKKIDDKWEIMQIVEPDYYYGPKEEWRTINTATV